MSVFGIDVDPSQIVIIPEGATKQEALDQLVSAVAEHVAVTDMEAFRAAVYEREASMSTGIGGGIAIPHVRMEEVREPVLGVAIAPSGVEYGALDDKPVHLLLLFAADTSPDSQYLRLLARVMTALRDDTLLDRLVACRSVQCVQEALNG